MVDYFIEVVESRVDPLSKQTQEELLFEGYYEFVNKYGKDPKNLFMTVQFYRDFMLQCTKSLYYYQSPYSNSKYIMNHWNGIPVSVCGTTLSINILATNGGLSIRDEKFFFS